MTRSKLLKYIGITTIFLCVTYASYILFAIKTARADLPGVGFFVQEADGDPNEYAIVLKLPNGTLSVTDGVATYAGESGAAAEVQDEAVTDGNFNGDTSHAVSQDDFWDWLIQYDTDMDGDLSDESIGGGTVLTDEASLYTALSDVSQFYEPGDLLQTESGNTPTTLDTSGQFNVDADDEQWIMRIGTGTKKFDFSGDSSGYVLKSDGSGNFSLAADATGAGGSAIILDLADDASNESVDITEIATTGDTNSIFTESSADKLLINVGQNWPTADAATTATTATTANAGDSATAFFSAGTIEHEYGGLEADVSAYDGLLRITGGATSAVSVSANVLSLLGAADYDAIQTQLAIDDIITLTGIAEGTAHLGTFTGTTITDSSTIKTALQELETAVESGGGSGDITAVLGDDAGAVPVLFQGWTAFSAADATPDVSTATLFRTVDTTTITDFDGTPVDGQFLYVYCGDATVFDLTSSGLVAANRTSDLTCTVGQITAWKYRTDTWYCENCPDEYETLSSSGIVVNSSGTPIARSLNGTGLAYEANADGTGGNPTINVEPASVATTNGGSSTAVAVTPDSLGGSIYGTMLVTLQFTAAGDSLGAGDGQIYWTVPFELNGMDLVSVQGAVYTASSSGTPTFQVHNLTDTTDMLSTAITVDVSEYSSATAATAPVINTSADDVATGDRIRIDCDAAGTGTNGGEVTLGFRIP